MNGWAFRIVPDGWEPLPGGGLRHRDLHATAAASAVALQTSLRAYVESQIEPGADFQGPHVASMGGSGEALLLTVFRLGIAQRSIFARSGDVVGILTMTGPPSANRDFIEIVRGASFR
jgi:hypothetical protein